ncbi:MAG: hypothetical protein ACK4IA_14905 [Paracoccus hibiscisoli]|uniref:hypothetical protein n=1 Tax=Paracoccus hibiscisoli TaxID=2023261 RepID=UPI003919CC6C
MARLLADASPRRDKRCDGRPKQREIAMNSIIYIVGLIVVVLFVLSFLGLR